MLRLRLSFIRVVTDHEATCHAACVCISAPHESCLAVLEVGTNHSIVHMCFRYVLQYVPLVLFVSITCMLFHWKRSTRKYVEASRYA